MALTQLLKPGLHWQNPELPAEATQLAFSSQGGKQSGAPVVVPVPAFPPEVVAPEVVAADDEPPPPVLEPEEALAALELAALALATPEPPVVPCMPLVHPAATSSANPIPTDFTATSPLQCLGAAEAPSL